MYDILIPRTYYIDQIRSSLRTPVMKVITGMRRVGKSSIMKSLITELTESGTIRADHIFSMNKELPESFSIRTGEDLYTLLMPFLDSVGDDRFVIAIDEIQEIEGWERILSGILAQYGSQSEIFITGSNSHLLSGELSTLIAGRYIAFQIFPLSWSEYLEFSGLSRSRESFLEYLEYGGLPGIHAFPREARELRMSYLRSVYESIVLRDIVERFSIRGFDFLRQLYHYTSANIGNIISTSSISKYLKSQKINISVDSILQYLSYGTHTSIFDRVSSVEPNQKRTFEIYNKYYIGDIGLRNSIIGYQATRDIGGLLENIVSLLLRKYGYLIQIGRIENQEIDFIAEKDGQKIYLQVTLSLLSDETRNREYASLRKVDDHFIKYVIHFDDMDWGVTEDGIGHISILDFEEFLSQRS